MEKSKIWLIEFLSELLDNIPAKVHLLLLSLVMPGINLSSLKAKRNVFVIEESLLSFDEEETALLLDEV